MDPELKKLMCRLSEAQSKPVGEKLSERCCAEVLQQLRDGGGLDLVYSTDGKEYITKEHLEKEISDEIDARGGRMVVSDLRGLLNVPMAPYIEEGLKNVVDKRDDLQLHGGETFSRDYLDGVVAETAALLRQKGSVETAEIAKRFRIDAKLVIHNIENIDDCTLHGSTLYTSSYIRRKKAALRGAFNAATSSVQVQRVVSKIAGTDRELQNELYNQVSTWHSEGQLAGTLTGLRGVYTPNVFETFRISSLDKEFQTAGYVTYAQIKELDIKGPQAYAKERYKGVALPTCHISENTLQSIYSFVIEDFSESDAMYSDFASVVPACFTANDNAEIGKLLETKLPKATRDDVVLLDTSGCFVAKKALRKCLDIVEAHAPRDVKDARRTSTASTTTTRKPTHSTKRKSSKRDTTSATPVIKPDKPTILDRIWHGVFVVDGHEDDEDDMMDKEAFLQDIWGLIEDRIDRVYVRLVADLDTESEHSTLKTQQALENTARYFWNTLQLEAASVTSSFYLPDSVMLTEVEAGVLHVTCVQFAKSCLNLALQSGGDTVLPVVHHELPVISDISESLKRLSTVHRLPLQALLAMTVSTPSPSVFIQTAEKLKDSLGIFLRIAKPRELKDLKPHTLLEAARYLPVLPPTLCATRHILALSLSLYTTGYHYTVLPQNCAVVVDLLKSMEETDALLVSYLEDCFGEDVQLDKLVPLAGGRLQDAIRKKLEK
eukprot:TRINITY_DN552_c6_g1_i1.p1 TRINITY_DN552_c6_g1~~TRINITY_DN552_c6_g1_i1.p1  ORF type:complete len:718 (+),score=152.27 TRINITY_DN552_c6_g1_i1:47-2200(+)